MKNQDLFKIFINCNNIEAIKKLIKKEDVNPSYNDNDALVFSCEKNYIELFKVLYNNEKIHLSEINKDYLLATAIMYNSYQITKMLINDFNVNPANNFNNSLLKAAESGCIKTMKLILKDKRVNPENGDNHAIRCAFLNKNLNVVSLLWKNDNVKNKGFYGFSKELIYYLELHTKIESF
jgi:hypothetical protein